MRYFKFSSLESLVGLWCSYLIKLKLCPIISSRMLNGHNNSMVTSFAEQQLFFLAGIQPILPIYREAILNGEPELKEAASIALTEVIQITSTDSLKLSVIHVTGPLIRILGDRFAPSVKVAVLNTIGLLLEKVATHVYIFFSLRSTLGCV